VAIFLHFLNREAYRATNTRYPIELIGKYLRILAIGRADPLYTNFSNLLEGGLFDGPTGQLAKHLLALHQLLVDGERPSMQEFVDSRTVRYRFDSLRYPMYFGPNRVTDDFVPQKIRTDSITSFLASEIEALTSYNKAIKELPLLPSDARLIRESVQDFSRLMGRREESGITRSLFERELPGVQHESAAARLISSLYIQKYMCDLDCAIATGIPDLTPFEQLARNAYDCNLLLLETLLRVAGLEAALVPGSKEELLAALRGTESQVQFSAELDRVCQILSVINPANQPIPAATAARALLTKFAKPVLALSPSMYDVACVNVRRIVQEAKQDKTFAKACEEQFMKDASNKTVLLVTATTVETQALVAVAKSRLDLEPRYTSYDNYILMDFGVLRHIRIVAVQCEAGSIGPSGSTLVISEAIATQRPSAVLMGGIAFGVDPAKQALGDILVSKSIVEYERAKIKGNDTIQRGQTIEASPKLLSVFRAAEASYQGGIVRVGQLLSGEKLIDSALFLEALRDRFPEAIGGEMEGAGLAAAAGRAKIDWIVVKAIVDWAREKSQQNAPDHQRRVAEQAFSFILDTLARIGL
jgi:nucleoside phosphorylase